MTINDQGRFGFVSEARRRRRRVKLGLCASLHAPSCNDNWVAAMRTVWCVASCDKFISYFIYKYVWLFKNILKKKNSSSFFLEKFVEPWTGRREGSGGENAGMWGSDITGRYITDSQVHCQTAPGLCATHLWVVLSPLECVWIAGIGQTNIE